MQLDQYWFPLDTEVDLCAREYIFTLKVGLCELEWRPVIAVTGVV